MTILLRGVRPVATSPSAEMVSTLIRRLQTVRFIRFRKPNGQQS
jgi:hypothetical protein